MKKTPRCPYCLSPELLQREGEVHSTCQHCFAVLVKPQSSPKAAYKVFDDLMDLVEGRRDGVKPFGYQLNPSAAPVYADVEVVAEGSAVCPFCESTAVRFGMRGKESVCQQCWAVLLPPAENRREFQKTLTDILVSMGNVAPKTWGKKVVLKLRTPELKVDAPYLKSVMSCSDGTGWLTTPHTFQAVKESLLSPLQIESLLGETKDLVPIIGFDGVPVKVPDEEPMCVVARIQSSHDAIRIDRRGTSVLRRLELEQEARYVQKELEGLNVLNDVNGLGGEGGELVRSHGVIVLEIEVWVNPVCPSEKGDVIAQFIEGVAQRRVAQIKAA